MKAPGRVMYLMYISILRLSNKVKTGKYEQHAKPARSILIDSGYLTAADTRYINVLVHAVRDAFSINRISVLPNNFAHSILFHSQAMDLRRQRSERYTTP